MLGALQRTQAGAFEPYDDEAGCVLVCAVGCGPWACERVAFADRQLGGIKRRALGGACDKER